VEDPEAIETQFGLPVYAVVPHSAKQTKLTKKGSRRNRKCSVLSSRDDKDHAVESLRGLRTWLNFAFAGAKNNVLLITGPGPGVGKSFVSVNLATVLANAGKRTLLIDADLRKGHLHQYFNMKRAEGLSEAVAGNVSTEEVVYQTEVDKLSILPTGTLPPNPSELLLHERFISVMDKVSGDFDQVVVDSPPVLAVTDAAILGRLAGVVLLVVKANMHHLREIEQSVKQLRQVDVNLRGVVFNDMKSNKLYGYGKYYGYAYGYPTT
jgi:tyrosine-protein kinase Etk/Wzc